MQDELTKDIFTTLVTEQEERHVAVVFIIDALYDYYSMIITNTYNLLFAVVIEINVSVQLAIE